MKVSRFIENYFWIFLIAGILIGLWKPAPYEIVISLPRPLLMIMLFMAFLKTDLISILENIRDYKLMIYIVCIYMFIIPLLFYFSVNLFNQKLALGILLLTSMPAGISTPALTDIVRGNISLSMSLVIVTQLIAPFTVPFLFGLIKIGNISIDQISLFREMEVIVFLPMILSQITKRYFPVIIIRSQHLFTSINIILLFALVYAAIASQSDIILANPASLIWKTAILYAIFILLHAIGYLVYYKGSKEDKVTIAIGAAYMNNGMAIVLATSYFEPSVLVLMVLSELPWSTLPAPFKKLIRYF